jgi:hypothetical protein
MQKNFALLVVLMVTLNAYSRSCDFKDGCCSSPLPFFIVVGSGYSASMCAQIHPDPALWDAVKEGYSAKLGHAALFEAGVGYTIRDWLAASVVAAYRGVYRYKKFQSLQAAQTPTLGTTKVRYFDVENASVLFNLMINSAHRWAWHFHDCMSLAPVVAGGLGLAQNRVSNFHTVLGVLAPSETNYVESIHGLYVNKYTFAAHADVGISWAMCRRVQCDLGYRFYYGGTFKTSDYGLDVPGGIMSPQEYNRPIQETPWCSKLKANEFFIDVYIAF